MRSPVIVWVLEKVPVCNKDVVLGVGVVMVFVVEYLAKEGGEFRPVRAIEEENVKGVV